MAFKRFNFKDYDLSGLKILYFTPHFSFYELIYSPTAEIRNLNNMPDWDSLTNMYRVCRHLEILRSDFGSPIIVTSGFRCFTLNQIVGGVDNSLHMFGRAVDITCECPFEWDTLVECAQSMTCWTECIVYPDKHIIHLAI